jgi:hypothetical protein
LTLQENAAGKLALKTGSFLGGSFVSVVSSAARSSVTALQTTAQVRYWPNHHIWFTVKCKVYELLFVIMMVVGCMCC